MKFIKKHITAIIVAFICLLLVILAGFAVYRMFYPSNDKSVYGDRLTEAPEITDSVIAKIKEDILALELVNSINYKTSVKTMKFYIDVKETTKIDKAKSLGEKVLENLSSEVKDFYDISIYLTQTKGEMIEYPAIGYHAKGGTEFNWVINKEVEDSEK